MKNTGKYLYCSKLRCRSRFTLCVILVFLSCSLAFSHDFGLILDQNAGVGSMGSQTYSEYTGMLIPRFSTFIADRGYLYISAGLSVEFKDDWFIIPELLRTEFSWQFDKGFLSPGLLTTGRMYYSDPLGFVAEGLFDGVYYTFDMMDLGLLSAGMWYTGLLYKNRANVMMTTRDLDRMGSRLDYKDFANTYFAPSRFFTAIEWEPQRDRDLYRLNLSFIAQFDLTGDDFHTQYLVGNLVIPFNSFILNLGSSFELMNVSNELGFAFAGIASVILELPFRYDNELTVSLSTSSGQFGNVSINAYIPITARYPGRILRENFSALTIISADYITMLAPNFSVGASTAYFIRNDLYTSMLYGQSNGYFMGAEFYGSLLWSVLSDLQINVGAGIFLPQLGNSARNADPIWRVEIGAILSIR